MEYSEKQQQIMDVALMLFADKGYDGTSIRDIAQKAGVNIAMVSYYFGSKEKLFEAIFIAHFAFVGNKLEHVIYQKEPSPAVKVEQVIDIYIDTFKSRQSFHRLMIREASLIKSERIFELIAKMKEKNKVLVGRAVKAGQRSGHFRKDVDVFILASILIGSVNQTISNSRYEAERTDLDEADTHALIGEKVEALRRHLKQMFLAFLTLEKG